MTPGLTVIPLPRDSWQSRIVGNYTPPPTIHKTRHNYQLIFTRNYTVYRLPQQVYLGQLPYRQRDIVLNTFTTLVKMLITIFSQLFMKSKNLQVNPVLIFSGILKVIRAFVVKQLRKLRKLLVKKITEAPSSRFKKLPHHCPLLL